MSRLIPKAISLLLTLALAVQDARAATGSLASALINGVRRMGLVSKNSARENAKILADNLESLADERLLGLLRKTEATGAEDPWSPEDVNELVRLVHRRTEPGPQGRLFPHVVLNADGTESASLRTIWEPDVAELARAVPWGDRTELVNILNREFPRIGLARAAPESLDGVSDERLGTAVLIATMIRSDGMKRSPYRHHIARIHDSGVGFFHPANGADISYIEETEIFYNRLPSFYSDTAMKPKIEAMREDLVRDMADIARHFFGAARFDLEDFRAAFGGRTGHYEDYEPATSLGMAIHLNIVEVSPTGGLKVTLTPGKGEMGEDALEHRLNRAYASQYADALDIPIEETIEARRREALRGLAIVDLEELVRAGTVEDLGDGNFQLVEVSMEETIEAGRMGLEELARLGAVEEAGDGHYRAVEGPIEEIIESGRVDREELTRAGAVEEAGDGSLRLSENYIARELALKSIRESFEQRPFSIDEFARLDRNRP